MIIREEIDALDESRKATAASRNIDPEEDSDTLDIGDTVEEIAHIIVGSPLKSVSVTDIEANHSNDTAFRDFRTKLVDSLEFIIGHETGVYRPVRIHRDHQVLQFSFTAQKNLNY